MKSLMVVSLLVVSCTLPSLIYATPGPRARNERLSSHFDASKRHRSVRPRKSIASHFGKAEQDFSDYDDVPEEISGAKAMTPPHRRAQIREERRERRRQRKQARKDMELEERFSSEPRNRRREQRQRMRDTTVDVSWLAANVSSLWEIVRRLEETVTSKHHHRSHSGNSKLPNLSRGRGGKADRSDDRNSPSASSVPEVLDTASKCPHESACVEFPGAPICNGAGTCESCSCKCDNGNYGVHCHCNDNSCEWHNGMLCGGPKHGQCRCGQCVCRPGYTGSACACTISNDTCIHPETQTICSNHGNCQCGVCKCYDEYGGRFCEDTVYAAGVCERLKPCVQCRAFNLDLPQCSQCEVIVNLVDELEPNLKTCVMVGSGCFLQYSYIRHGPSAYTVLVRREDKCISQRKQ